MKPVPAFGTALIGAAAAAVLWSQAAAAERADFPRLMGMNVGAKNYHDPAYQRELTRLDIVILGFYKGWNPGAYAENPAAAMRRAVQAIKALNPKMLVGQYTILNETFAGTNDAATADLREKLEAHKWWLRNAAGRKVQWTARYSTWEINFTTWAGPDAAGRRWPQWLAERNHEVFFRAVPEFDIVYLDNVMSPPRITADWDGDGVNDDPKSAKILKAHHAAHLAHWKRIRELHPRVLLIGNADNDLGAAEWRSQLDGAFLEALLGERWSIESWGGWGAMMERYRAALRNVRAPGIVGFGVHGNPADTRFFRYAFASCLLDDGYFSFTDRSKGHSGVPWFDEYGFGLGRALEEPPAAAWREGVWRRDFEHGVVLVNPTTEPKTVSPGPGLLRLKGTQDPAVNSGAAAGRVTLEPKDGIVLRRRTADRAAL